MVGLGLPRAAQFMTAISLCTAVTSRGSISHRGGTTTVLILYRETDSRINVVSLSV